MITYQEALVANTFYHATVKYADGKRAYQARRNGKTQTWKTRPGQFRIPIKIGYKGYGNITNANASEWNTTDPS